LISQASAIEVSSKPLFKISGKDFNVIEQYLDIHAQFFKNACRPGVEQEFSKLFSGFRGEGYYIPVDEAGKLDRDTINRFIPELVRKRDWIFSQIEYTKTLKDFNALKAPIKALYPLIDELLKFREGMVNGDEKDAVNRASNRSKYQFISFRAQMKRLIDQFAFLKSYRHPVDHFELRQSYDKVKDVSGAESKKRANEIYFYRKIVQDGAQNPNNSGSDSFLRAGIDTVALQLDRAQGMTDDLRYDVEWILKAMESHVDAGRDKKILRLEEWRERTQKSIEFYESLKKGKVFVRDHFETGEQLIESQSKAKFILKSFVLEKQKGVYQFWNKRSELMQALFAIETILYNEVGRVDGEDGLERRDVTQVVLNRTTLPEYSEIPETDPLFALIADKDHKGPWKKNPWLNVLFKEGEFSFTYYFIHGNLRIYCPDMTRIGRHLRKENLKIALEHLRKPRPDFDAVRYFSRHSMLGRIDMGPIWSDHEVIAERAGKQVKVDKRLLKLYGKGEYRFFYNFIDPLGAAYKVVEIDGEVYSLNSKLGLVFKYRNPHYFRYFRLRQAL
jgi:hypothetical protein